MYKGGKYIAVLALVWHVKDSLVWETVIKNIIINIISAGPVMMWGIPKVQINLWDASFHIRGLIDNTYSKSYE